MSIAGTRKSYLIKAIRCKFNKIRKNNNLSQPILVLAPTGVAAFNIHSSTIHSALSIPVNKKNFDITDEHLKQLQTKLQWVNYSIIDEMSSSIIFVRDFEQFSPVCDLSIYVQDSYTVNKINLEKLHSLNQPVAKICAVHSDNHETSTELVNSAMGKIMNILFDKECGPTSLPNSVLVAFDIYYGSTITMPEGIQAITVHKSQGLTLSKAIVNIEERKFAAGLSFVAIS
ncbi:1318_t:CDS:2 [Cetraspora pellucida]|uniref:ATP-dependent DNA helicase n=1 Tax=Cetraspora pellucida TaxID=1433469 RepID=A0A9N9NIK1_9GLOM|nr:1318_t:CDS:2 [Cetraspora pellucida]